MFSDFVLSLLGLIMAHDIHLQSIRPDDRQAARAYAQSGAVQQAAAVRLAQATPSLIGAISTLDLAPYMPAGQSPSATWTSTVDAGRVVCTWAAGTLSVSAAAVAQQLTVVRGFDVAAGLSSASPGLIRPAGLTPVSPTPPSVPASVPVACSQVTP